MVATVAAAAMAIVVAAVMVETAGAVMVEVAADMVAVEVPPVTYFDFGRFLSLGCFDS